MFEKEPTERQLWRMKQDGIVRSFLETRRSASKKIGENDGCFAQLLLIATIPIAVILFWRFF